MKRLVYFALAAGIVAACDGFKEAMTAHVDVVARAGGQELSVNRLSQLMGSSKVPLNKDVAKAVADLWVSYQLLGQAAANGDSLNDPKMIDDAMWAAVSNARVQKFYQNVAKTWTTADSGSEASYNQGNLLAARHILIPTPPTAATQAEKDSIRRIAEGIRGRVTAANFAQMAQQYGTDATKSRGGYLGVFAKGQMVPEFERAVLALKPGDIAPGLVQTQFGYHVIQRMPYADVKSEYGQAMAQRGTQVAESTYLAKVEASSNVSLKTGTAKTVKAVAQDVDAHRKDNTVLATFKGGELTAGRLARWIEAFPPQTRIREQVAQAPDSLIPLFVKQIVRNELLLRQADSAKVALDTGEVRQLHTGWSNMVTMAYVQLGVEPRLLFDSAQSKTERQRIASEKVEGYMDQLLAERKRFVDVPPPLAAALREKYDAKVNPAGLERAVEQAAKLRAQRDSAAAANRPPSEVPLPGAAPAPPPPAHDSQHSAHPR
jgi:parvulin-like peptidyl-prolyl cis-trans isomerase-like protein